MLPIDRTTHERVTAALGAAQRARAAAGWAAFSTMTMPSEKEENWRYVHPEVVLEEYSIATDPGDPIPATLGRAGVPGAVSVDGHTVAVQSGEDVAVRRWADATHPGPQTPSGDLFEALHEAFAVDGIEVEVARGARPTEPVMIELQAVTSGVAAMPRLRIVAGATAEVAVVVHQRSPDGLPALVLPRFEIETGDGARVLLTVIQEWGDATAAMARHHYVAGRDSTVGLAEAGIGGRYSRLHLTVDLVGDGAAARVVGAYFGDGEQTMDYRYFLRHAARSTTSEMFLKGAVAGESRSVFSGLIRIEPEGQKSNAHQTNRNLVLSDGAEAHSVPNLEILADDVRCGHGSAVGPLDEEQRYYLMSRGLDRSRSDRLQVKGFFEDALLRFPDRRFEPMLRDRMMNKYARVAS